MNTEYDATGLNLSTASEVIEEDYFPSISLLYDKDGRVKYKPVHYEKDLVMYDLSVTQGVYPDGTYSSLYVNIKIDGSKNVIKDRFEILDL